MRVIDLATYLSNSFSVPFFVGQFGEGLTEPQGLVRIYSSIQSNKQVAQVRAQVLIKSLDQQELESLGNQIYEHFNLLTNFSLGTSSIILSRSTIPEFVEKMDDDYYLYSVDLEFIENKQ
jgi:hypothetical protein